MHFSKLNGSVSFISSLKNTNTHKYVYTYSNGVTSPWKMDWKDSKSQRTRISTASLYPLDRMGKMSPRNVNNVRLTKTVIMKMSMDMLVWVGIPLDHIPR